MRRPMLLLALALAAAPAPGGIADLNARLMASDSATAVLQQVCDARAPGARIEARPLVNRPKGSAPSDVRRDLGARRGEPVAYRRVELSCAGEVLSRADNWYLPDRLTPVMRQALATTRTPFGVVVRPLGYHRKTLRIDYLSARVNRRHGDVLQHRAVLMTPDNRPFSLVVETYSSQALRTRP